MTLLKIVLTIAFALGGGAKVAGAKPLREQFEEFGLPRWSMTAVGLLEIAGAIGLWIPALSFLASLGLLLLMVGAVGSHLKVKHSVSKVAPALVLLILTAVYAVMFLV